MKKWSRRNTVQRILSFYFDLSLIVILLIGTLRTFHTKRKQRSSLGIAINAYLRAILSGSRNYRKSCVALSSNNDIKFMKCKFMKFPYFRNLLEMCVCAFSQFSLLLCCSAKKYCYVVPVCLSLNPI